MESDSMAENAQSGNDFSSPIDLDQLAARLEALLKGYRAALRFAEHLPPIGRVKIRQPRSPQGRFGQFLDQITNPSRRWVARSPVRLFLEAHIRGKLEEINRNLRIEASVHLRTQEKNDRAERLEAWIDSLNQLQSALFGWRQRGALFTRAPLLPIAIALATPLIAQFTGVDLSSIDAATKSLIQGVQTPGSLQNLLSLGLLIGVLYVYLSPLPVTLGFHVKRAILSGGNTLRNLFDEPEQIQWADFPRENVYRLENEVFEAIGVPKVREFPLDFVIAFLPMFVLIGTVLGTWAVFQRIIGGDSIPIWDILGMLSFWVVLLGYIYYGWKNYRLRLVQGNL